MLLNFLFLIFSVQASDLEISISGNARILSQDQLLKNDQLKTVALPADPMNSNKKSVYKAIAVKDLITQKQLKNSEAIYFVASDGMTVSLDKQRLLASRPKDPKAWLAIAPLGSQWPLVKRTSQPIGPYYLFWTNPGKEVGPEEWPYQVVKIELKDSIAHLYPELTVPQGIKTLESARMGESVFLKNCMPCHSLNGRGSKKMGPDLLWPTSVLEYWKLPFLKKYIRDPKSFRHWPGSKMPSFTTDEISEVKLNQVLDYLKFLTKKRAREK